MSDEEVRMIIVLTRIISKFRPYQPSFFVNPELGIFWYNKDIF